MNVIGGFLCAFLYFKLAYNALVYADIIHQSVLYTDF